MSNWSIWVPFTEEEVRLAPRAKGVYQIALVNGWVNHPRGKSRTVYFGKSEKGESTIRQRLTRHLGGIGSDLVDEMVNDGIPLKVRWKLDEQPGKTECELITGHKSRHGEKPYANKQGCNMRKLRERLTDDG